MNKKKFILGIVLGAILTSVTAGVIYYFSVALPEVKEKEALQKEYDEFYAQCLEQYAEENKRYEPLAVDVVFVGDSLTAGYDVKSHYPEFLVLNRAIGGETTYGLKARLAVSVLDVQPKVCVMLIGGNNPDTMFEDYEDILITFREKMPQTKTVLVSHAPTSGEHWGKRNQQFAYNNVKIKLLAEKYGCTYVDLYGPMLDLETGKMNAAYTVDGAHFSPQGYGVYTAQLKPVLEELLK